MSINKKSRAEQKDLIRECNASLRRAVNTKLVELQSPLVNDGMEVASWDGSTVDKVHPVVSNSTVDREEAYGIAQVRPGHGNVPYRNCTDCLPPTNLFNDGRARAARRTVAAEPARVQAAIQHEEMGDH